MFSEIEVRVEFVDNKLEILFSNVNSQPRYIECCSGAEKSLASIVTRMALLEVSSLPKGDIFILDEPGTSLDSNNMVYFTEMINIVKNSFKIVLLISHLQNLKDTVDDKILINNTVDGKALINY